MYTGAIYKEKQSTVKKTAKFTFQIINCTREDTWFSILMSWEMHIICIANMQT